MIGRNGFYLFIVATLVTAVVLWFLTSGIPMLLGQPTTEQTIVLTMDAQSVRKKVNASPVPMPLATESFASEKSMSDVLGPSQVVAQESPVGNVSLSWTCGFGVVILVFILIALTRGTANPRKFL